MVCRPHRRVAGCRVSTAPRCPRFNSCSAPICPLDPKWPLADHRRDERVCGLLSELVKPGGKLRLEGALSTDQLSTLVREWPKVEARWGTIRRKLKDSAKTGSRIDALNAVRNRGATRVPDGESGRDLSASVATGGGTA